jgi:hypothetical protein
MGLFSSRQTKIPPPSPAPAAQIPVLPVDLSKRYDVYCSDLGHDRLYENVRFIGIRTFERITEFSSIVGGFLEIEAANGSCCLIPSYGVRLICEHGTQPIFKVLRYRRNQQGF